MDYFVIREIRDFSLAQTSWYSRALNSSICVSRMYFICSSTLRTLDIGHRFPTGNKNNKKINKDLIISRSWRFITTKCFWQDASKQNPIRKIDCDVKLRSTLRLLDVNKFAIFEVKSHVLFWEIWLDPKSFWGRSNNIFYATIIFQLQTSSWLGNVAGMSVKRKQRISIRA